MLRRIIGGEVVTSTRPQIMSTFVTVVIVVVIVIGSSALFRRKEKMSPRGGGGVCAGGERGRQLSALGLHPTSILQLTSLRWYDGMLMSRAVLPPPPTASPPRWTGISQVL